MNKVNFEDRAKIYADAADTFGNDIQIVVALEELSEVQKELCKALRGGLNIIHLAEEVADATIMLEQIRQMFNINEPVCGYMDEKMLRLQNRIQAFRRGERKIAE